MGIHANWVALASEDPNSLFETLGLQEVGGSQDEFDGDYAYAVTPQGWLVLVGRSMKLDLPKLLPRLSEKSLVIGAEVSEIVMVSSLQGWRGGARLWSVEHNPERGLDDLNIQGEPPAELAAIHSRLAGDQAAEADQVDHIFDAPLALCAQICGYRPDEPIPVQWTILAPVRGRAVAPVKSNVPAAIRADLFPALAALGWRVEPIRLDGNGATYDASRFRNGRLEALSLLWQDDRRTLEIYPKFAVVEGEAPDGRLTISRSFRNARPTAVERFKTWRRQLGKPEKTYEEKVNDAVAGILADLREYDEIIAASEPTPGR
jgi:hypothetical protein